MRMKSVLSGSVERKEDFKREPTVDDKGFGGSIQNRCHHKKKKENMMSDFLTEERLAEMLSMKKSTLARLRREQNVPHIRIGKLIRYSRDEVEEWLKQQYTDYQKGGDYNE